MKGLHPSINASHLNIARQYLKVFMPLTEPELEELFKYCEWKVFDKRTVILAEGEVDNYLNIVIKGLVRKYIKVKKTEQTLQLATEGHMVQSEISFLNRIPSSVELQALESTILLSISHANMQLALSQMPFGERLGRLILTNMYIKKDERRFERASKSVRELFQSYLVKHPHMLQRVPQKYIASYLNIKPETFSRLKRMAMSK